MLAKIERKTFMEYVYAIQERVPNSTTAREARAACPDEYEAWREAYRAAYGEYPS